MGCQNSVDKGNPVTPKISFSKLDVFCKDSSLRIRKTVFTFIHFYTFLVLQLTVLQSCVLVNVFCQ